LGAGWGRAFDVDMTIMSSKEPAGRCIITILPWGKRLEGERGENLLRFLASQGYPLPSACGGQGSCGKCRVLIREGLKPPTEAEQAHLSQAQLARGWRLACQQWLDRDLVLELPSLEAEEALRAKERLEEEFQLVPGAPKFELDPGIERVYLELPPPGPEDQRPDTLRLQEGLGRKLSFPLGVLRRLPGVLREGDFKVTLTLEGGRILNIEPGRTERPPLGLALDLGTTTLAGYLLDLSTGRELALRSLANPQVSFGADVISRIRHVRERGEGESEEGLRELQAAVISGANALIEQLCQATGADPAQIYKVTVVGNPTMVHLFLGIDPRGIDHSPYIPVLRDGLSLRAEELGLKVNPEARVYILPAVSGYVGADITAGVLLCGLHRREELSLFVDLGTNAEIVLGNRERLLACSTPAGPAFEGARIKHGMSALPGAIAHAHLNDDRLELEVIGGGPPRGICGSGLIDLVAELCKAGLIDPQGRLLPRDGLPLGSRVTPDEGGRPRFLVTADGEHGPIYLTQQDIRELQLAKGAIRAGVELILREWGAAPDEVEVVYLAGAFGSYVRRESVLAIGMLPPLPVEKLKPVGNAAGQGAIMALLNRGALEELQKLTERMEYLELSYRSDFNEAFIRSLHFPSLGQGRGRVASSR